VGSVLYAGVSLRTNEDGLEVEECELPEKIAILCSDIHLSHTPPMSRSGEIDWYEAMSRPLQELRDLAESDGLPVLCGGDVFDRWNSPPKLITFAMRMLPTNFASVMGQHDLPYHSWEQREISAFWTLVEAGAIELCSGWREDEPSIWRGFQWNEDIEPNRERDKRRLNICIAHRYVWFSKPRLPVDRCNNHLREMLGRLEGYRVALFGDNHRGFCWKSEERGLSVFNAGTLMRRRADERDYKPMVGLLLEDGTVEPYFLDTSRDKFDGGENIRQAERTLIELDSFVDELRNLGDGGLDFRKAVEEAMVREQVSKEVRRVILEAIEKGTD